MDRTADRTLSGFSGSGERGAAELRRQPARGVEARRLRSARGGSNALNRLTELAGRLLGTPSSQISLLTDVQVVASGGGLPPGSVGNESPLETSLCTVTAAGAASLVVSDARADDRVRDLPPVTSGQVGAYLGTPLTTSGGLSSARSACSARCRANGPRPTSPPCSSWPSRP